eukprot:6182143-Amphidinium_carterae.1
MNERPCRSKRPVLPVYQQGHANSTGIPNGIEFKSTPISIKATPSDADMQLLTRVKPAFIVRNSPFTPQALQRPPPRSTQDLQPRPEYMAASGADTKPLPPAPAPMSTT